jgi:polar amino acid transport system substrate-binding protein
MKLKKSLVTLATASLLTLSVVPGAQAAGVTTITPGTLTNCVDIEYPPMEYFANGTSGEAIGFDIEGSAALAKELGLKINQLNTSFDGLMPSLVAGKCDIMWTGLYLSNKRLAVADGVVYMNTGAGLVVPTGNPKKISTAMSLCGLTVSVQGEGSNWQILQDQNKACAAAGKKALTVQSYPKTAQTVAAVLSGKADALIETDVAVPEITNASSGKLVEQKKVFKASTQFAVYMQKGSSNFYKIKSAVRKLIQDGTLGAIATKYGLDPKKVTSLKKAAI